METKVTGVLMRKILNEFKNENGIRSPDANYIWLTVKFCDYMGNVSTVKKKVYFLLDPTHNMKNLYHNWTHHRHMFYPKKTMQFRQGKEVEVTDCTSQAADFSVLVHLYDREKHQSFRYASHLTEACVRPKNILRCNAAYTFKVFDQRTVDTLEYYAEKDGKNDPCTDCRFH
eukprot:Nk52_evm1s146 gene=Nk52_evmTU1s146